MATVAELIDALNGVKDKSVPVLMSTPEQFLNVAAISVDDPDDPVVWIMPEVQ